MGARSGSYSRNIFDEEKRYYAALLQQAKAVVDADVNDVLESQMHMLQRVVQNLLGDGSPNNGFLIVGTGANNDFTVKGGDGTIEGAGRIWVSGFCGLLESDTTFKSTSVTEPQINAVSTGLTATVLTDTSTDFTFGGAPNNLAGLTLVPDVTDGTGYTIASNTATTITVSGDMTLTAATGDHYRVELSTPGGARTDVVFLDCYLDEIDSVEDPNLSHPLGGGYESMRRLQLIQTIRVRENSSSVPVNYVDSDGNQHYTLHIATLSRTATAAINAGMVTDVRPRFEHTLQELSYTDRDEIEELRPSEQGTPDNTVLIRGGNYIKSTGEANVTVADGVADAVTFPVVTANSRIDLLYLNDAGNAGRVAGVQAASPVPPDYPLDVQPVAEVTIDETGTVVINDADVKDVRAFFNLSPHPGENLLWNGDFEKWDKGTSFSPSATEYEGPEGWGGAGANIIRNATYKTIGSYSVEFQNQGGGRLFTINERITGGNATGIEDWHWLKGKWVTFSIDVCNFGTASVNVTLEDGVGAVATTLAGGATPGTFTRATVNLKIDNSATMIRPKINYTAGSVADKCYLDGAVLVEGFYIDGVAYKPSPAEQPRAERYYQKHRFGILALGRSDGTNYMLGNHNIPNRAKMASTSPTITVSSTVCYEDGDNSDVTSAHSIMTSADEISYGVYIKGATGGWTNKPSQWQGIVELSAAAS